MYWYRKILFLLQLVRLTWWSRFSQRKRLHEEDLVKEAKVSDLLLLFVIMKELLKKFYLLMNYCVGQNFQHFSCM